MISFCQKDWVFKPPLGQENCTLPARMLHQFHGLLFSVERHDYLKLLYGHIDCKFKSSHNELLFCVEKDDYLKLPYCYIAHKRCICIFFLQVLYFDNLLIFIPQKLQLFSILSCYRCWGPFIFLWLDWAIQNIFLPCTHPWILGRFGAKKMEEVICRNRSSK